MDAAFLFAYLLPIGFLAVFIGNLGKKFILYLVWGCIAAIPIILLMPVLTPLFPEIVSREVNLSPVFEEFFKALPLAIPVILGSRSSNRDMLVYAMASGIGFSVIENWMLFSPEKMSIIALVIRSFSTSLMHGCTCGVIGYGIILISDVNRKAVPALLLGFFTVAVLIHAFYNLNALFFGVAGILIDLVLPVLLFLFLLLCYHVDIPTLFRPDAG
jgi:RsiW-degrading membrane proteinase PrsW (M82 family)